MFRQVKRAITGLAILGLAAAIGMAPATHAAGLTRANAGWCFNGCQPPPWLPVINAGVNGFQDAVVTGYNFTPGGQVYVQVADPNGWQIVASGYTTATAAFSCSFLSCTPAGSITYYSYRLPNCMTNYNTGARVTQFDVAAYDFGSGAWSNQALIPAPCN